MVTIEYTAESVEGEPGPNFYWRGSPNDFLNLVLELHVLGEKSNKEIDLNKVAFVRVLDDYRVVARSSAHGNILCGLDKDCITIDLDCITWQTILSKFLMISFCPSHHYIDYDSNCVETANFIISSEG